MMSEIDYSIVLEGINDNLYCISKSLEKIIVLLENERGLKENATNGINTNRKDKPGK